MYSENFFEQNTFCLTFISNSALLGNDLLNNTVLSSALFFSWPKKSNNQESGVLKIRQDRNFFVILFQSAEL